MNSTLNSSTLGAVIRHFPLSGRPRPACPSLPERIHEIADIAHAATAALTGWPKARTP
jgi:hypothetical protein